MGSIQEILLRIPNILIALTVHEVSHGYVAYRFGDPTAKESGRLSLNPIRHLDPLGSLALLVLGYGWAKPVPVNPYYFKNRRLGMAAVSFAGPFSNILLGIVFALVLRFAGGSLYGVFGGYLYLFLIVGLSLNVGLAVFNLLPVPPLDGSKLLMSALPASARVAMSGFERYGIFVLLLLSFTGLLDRPLSFLMGLVLNFIMFIASLGM